MYSGILGNQYFTIPFCIISKMSHAKSLNTRRLCKCRWQILVYHLVILLACYSVCVSVFTLFSFPLLNCPRSSSYTLLRHFLILLLNPDFLRALIPRMYSPLFLPLNPFPSLFFILFFFSLFPSNFLSLLQLSSLIFSFFHNFPTYLFSVFPFI